MSTQKFLTLVLEDIKISSLTYPKFQTPNTYTSTSFRKSTPPPGTPCVKDVQYRLRVCSTGWKCAVQAEGLQYRMRVCRTGAEGVQYGLRVCSTGWGCAVRAEGVQYGLRVCSTGWGCAVRAEGVQYGLRVCSTGWGTSKVPHILSLYYTP